jgi:hypothetical protein
MRWKNLVAMVLSVALWSWVGVAQAAEKLEAVSALPDGLAKEIAAVVDANGQKVVGKDGAVCSVWLVKEVPIKANFKPTLNVKYPFAPGELVGVLQVQAKSKYTDFRGQEIKPGVFTLRYGQQPEDGNHVGTSDLADFLLAIPATVDTDAKPLGDFKGLSERSAKTAGSTHPAIFSLLPSDKPAEKPALTHDDSKEHTMLSTTLAAKGGAKVALRMVVIGKSGE